LTRSRKVAGPTLSERMRRSHATRNLSVSAIPFGLALRASSYFFAPILLSVPFISREMLALCFQ
jgi:hypothetical protein